MAGKYELLRAYLSSIRGDVCHASFARIEGILGSALPPSARRHQAWWANNSQAGRHSRASLDTGWRTEDLNLTAGTVTFRRVATADRQEPPSERSAPRTRSEALPPETRRGRLMDVASIMGALAEQRPVFHSEADFQHALAWAVREVRPDLKVRLEYRPPDFGRRYVDVWLAGRGGAMAVELKYFTRRLECSAGGEGFSLLDQGAQDLGRYDFLKDVQRLEELVSLHPDCTGVAVALTNDSGYWTPPRTDTTVDAAFRINEGRRVRGTLSWADHTGAGTMSGRTSPISLRGDYVTRWAEYSLVSAPRSARFRYLSIEVI